MRKSRWAIISGKCIPPTQKTHPRSFRLCVAQYPSVPTPLLLLRLLLSLLLPPFLFASLEVIDCILRIYSALHFTSSTCLNSHQNIPLRFIQNWTVSTYYDCLSILRVLRFLSRLDHIDLERIPTPSFLVLIKSIDESSNFILLPRSDQSQE
jgi:hypothetical protein